MIASSSKTGERRMHEMSRLRSARIRARVQVKQDQTNSTSATQQVISVVPLRSVGDLRAGVRGKPPGGRMTGRRLRVRGVHCTYDGNGSVGGQ